MASLIVPLASAHPAWGLDPLTPASPPAAVAPPDVIQVVTASGPTPVSGILTTDTVWGPQGSPYLVSGVLTVEAGVSLTVLAGTVIKMGLSSKIRVEGQLLVLGAADAKVIITSIKDDAVAGDSNGDGSASVPAPGDWRSIEIFDPSGVTAGIQPVRTIDYAEIRYGGADGGCLGSAVEIYGSSKVVVTNSLFSDHLSPAVHSAAGFTGLYRNTFRSGAGSGLGACVHGGHAELLGNVFDGVSLQILGAKARVWFNELRSGITAGSSDPSAVIPREQLDIRYNTILTSVSQSGTVVWKSNWWGHALSLPVCMTAIERDNSFPPVWLKDPVCPGGGMTVGGYSYDVVPGMSGPVSTAPVAAAREASAPAHGPVNLYTGAITYSVTDLDVLDAGKTLSAMRTYRSDKPGGGDVGTGWTVSYVESLTPDGFGGSVLGLPNGGSIPFAMDVTGGYTPAVGVTADYTTGPAGSTLTTGDDSTYQFSPAGELTGLLLGDAGHEVFIERSGGKVSKVVGVSGRFLAYQRANDRVDRVEDSTGRSAVMSYVDGRLSSVTGVDGQTERYEYDSAGRLTKVVAPSGIVRLAVGWTSDGRAEWIEQLGTGRTTFSYDPAASRTTATLANGDTVVYRYDQWGRLLTETRGASTRHVIYDGEGHVVVDVNGIPAVPMRGYGPQAAGTLYDGRGDVIFRVDPTGVSETSSYTPKHRPLVTSRSDGSTIARTYDADGRLSTITDPVGKLWRYTFNSRGQVLSQTDPLSRVRSAAYAANGDVQAITDETGATTSFGYDPQGRRTTVTNPLGQTHSQTYTTWDATATTTSARGGVTTIGYNNDRGYVSLTNPLGAVTRYEYDTAGRLCAVVDAKAGRTVAAYDQLGRVASVTDPRGSVTASTYTPEGWVATTTDPRGATTSYIYDPGGRAHRVVDALGQITQAVFDGAGRPTNSWTPDGAQTQVGYDAVGHPITLTTPLGNIWRTTYDGSGRAIKWTDPLGYFTAAAHDDAGRLVSKTDQLGVVTSFTYDDAQRSVTVADALGSISTVRRDAAGRLVARVDGSGVTTTYAYDADGNPTQTATAAGRWSYEYDLARRPTAQTDPIGRHMTAAYNELDQLTTLTYPDQTTTSVTYDAAGYQTGYTDRTSAHWTYVPDATGNITTATDPLGHTATFAFDLLGRPTSATDPSGVASHAAYDPMGRVAVTWDALGGSWVTTYDLDGRIIKSVDPAGAGSSYTYDKVGQMTSRRWGTGTTSGSYFSHSYTYDKAGRLTKATDPYTTTFEYDIRGRRISATDTPGNKTRFEYDLAGRPTKRVKPSGAVTQWTFDSSGRLERATDPMGNTTQHGWDAADQLLSVTLPRGGVYRYAYDAAGRLDIETNPLNSVTAYDYDGEGRPVSTTLPSGQTITATYDLAGNRLTSTAGGQTRTYGYDAAGRLTSAAATGMSLSYTYNNRGLLTRSTDTFGDTVYDYDHNGRVTTVTPPAAAATTYTYDGSRGLPATVRGAVNLDFTFNGAGQVTKTSSVTPTQGTENRSYDSAGRLTQISGPAYDAKLTYDIDSRVTMVCELATCYSSSKTHEFTYDNAGRLAQRNTFNSSGAQTASVAYGWDQDGNRTSVTNDGGTPATATFDLADRLTATSDGTTYSYDTDGRLRSKGAVAYDYNAFGELTAPGSASYTRDPLGRVASRTVGTVTESFSYDGIHGNLAASQATGGPITALVREPNGGLLAQATSGALAQRIATNPHGDAVASQDHNSTSSSTIRWTAAYDPFGSVTSTTGSTAVALGFQAMYTDQATGLVDMGFRHYDPTAGRFTTPDNIIGELGSPVSFNRYLYGNADPVNHFDPDGHWPDWLDDAIDFVADAFDSWSDEFFGELASGRDSSTSDDRIAQFVGGVVEATGELVVGATQTAAAVTTCSKHGGATCDALAQTFTKDGLNQAWHSIADPIDGCLNGAGAATCGRATVSIAELLIGTKGATKLFSTVKDLNIPGRIADNLRLAIDEWRLHPDAGHINIPGRNNATADSKGRLIPASVTRLPSGKLPSNWHFAGRKFDAPAWTPNLEMKYPDGVTFSADGFPDFGAYAIHTVKFDPPGFAGNHSSDFTEANRRAGLSETPDGYTWHHHQDTLTMQLIPTDMHNAVRHAGGVSIAKGRN